MSIKGFIVLEGLDGAGTTTQLDKLTEAYENIGKTVVRTFEPTDSEIGRLIRRVQRGEIRTTSESLALLYASDRHNHLFGENGIVENAEKGNIILSDRYFYSSYAYQSSFCDPEWVRDINNYPHPEILIFVDPPVDECLRRINARNEKKEIFEKKEILTRVRENYLKSFENLPSDVRFLHIEGILSIEETTKRILDFLSL